MQYKVFWCLACLTLTDLTTGLTCLAFGRSERALSPEAMGVPFGIGRLLVASILRFGFQDADAVPQQ